MATAQERMGKGYEANDKDREGKPPPGVAKAWRYNGQMERAATLDRGALSPQLRMEVGFYTAAKKVAADAGIDVSGPA